MRKNTHALNLIEGRTDEQKARLIHEDADVCHRAIDARETVKNIISDIRK